MEEFESKDAGILNPSLLMGGAVCITFGSHMLKPIISKTVSSFAPQIGTNYYPAPF